MKRDFTQETQDELRTLVQEADKKWFNWTDTIGDFCLSHGLAEVIDALSGTEAYQKALFDQNNTSLVDLQRIFDAVDSVEDTYGSKFSNHVESLQAVHGQLQKTANPMISKSDYTSSTDGLTDAENSQNQPQKNPIDFEISADYDAELLGYGLMADGRIWIDENGELCMDGSAEAEAYLASFSGKASFYVAGVEFDASGKAFVGARAAAEASSHISTHGFSLSAAASALAGASAEAKTGITYGAFSAGVTASAFAGAKASAHAGVALDPINGQAGVRAEAGAFAGAEARIEPSAQIGPVGAGCELGVQAGVGAHVGGTIGLEQGHLKVEVDLSAALGIGIHIKPSIDLDIGGTINAIGNFFNWF